MRTRPISYEIMGDQLIKKLVPRLKFIMLMTSIFSLAFSIQPVKASGATYIKADGTVEETDKIQRNAHALFAEETAMQSYVALFQNPSTQVSGYIFINTTWTLAGSPYVVTGDIIVLPGVFLTIEPGVTVKFTTGKRLLIDGGLLAQGNSTHRILFTSNSSAPASGDWGTINITQNSLVTSRISYSQVEYASTALTLAARCNITSSIFDLNNAGILLRNARNLFLDDVRIENNKGSGISGSSLQSNLQVRDTRILNNSIAGISCSLSSGNATFEHVRIAYNKGAGISCSAGNINLQDAQIVNNTGAGIIYYPTLWGKRMPGAIIVNAQIVNNTGSGIVYHKFFNADTHASIRNSTICSNLEGISIIGPSRHTALDVRNCTIVENFQDGAYIYVGDYSPYISGCNISANGQNGIEAAKCPATVYNCTIWNNGLTGYLHGGGYNWLFFVNASSFIGSMTGISAHVGTVSNCNISSCNVGINARSIGLRVDNCNISYCSTGIVGNCRIMNTVITRNSIGIKGEGCSIVNTIIDRNSKFGIQGSSSVYYSTVEGNLIGIKGGGSITNSTIDRNNQTGVLLGSATLALVNTTVSNQPNGIKGTTGTVTAENSKILNNTSGIQTRSLFATNCTITGARIGIQVQSGKINYCNIYSNRQYNIKYQGVYPTYMNATYNWWGTTNEILIDKRIYDYNDDPSLGLVIYNPYLTSKWPAFK